MTEAELLERFGTSPDKGVLPTIREVLRAEIAKERSRQGAGDTEIMKLCCVQLFSSGEPSDVIEIWRAKTASMDADGSIDIQLLCGAGLPETKAYLGQASTVEAAGALERLKQSEAAGDFRDFTVPGYRGFWQTYYAGGE